MSLLTERQTEVLRLVAEGCDYRQIADRLVIAHETVHRHMANIRARLDVPNAAAVSRGYQLGLLGVTAGSGAWSGLGWSGYGRQER